MKRQGTRKPIGIVSRKPKHRQTRNLAWSLSIAAHLAVIAALFWPRAANPPQQEQPILLSLVQMPKPEIPPGPPAPAATKLASAPAITRPTPAHPTVHSATPTHVSESARQLADDEDTAPDNSDLLTAADLAGASSVGAGGGGGGGGCNMARAVQLALQRDPLVHTAVADSGRLGKAVMVWNGDWVRSGAQDGKGLSAVREAIMWEVAFAPAACRNQPVHGLVLLALADGATRFAVGSGDWRWSDLLGVR